MIVPIKEWDGKMSRAIGRTALARTLNDALDTTYSDITYAYRELLKEGKYVTALSVKARYLGTDNNQTTFLELVSSL